MGFRLNVKGQGEEILLEKESIVDVKYISETPDDSNARATDLGVILEIKGKILAATNGEAADDTRKLAQWSLIPAESSDAYRHATLEVISAGQMVRKIDMNNVFVVDYIETFGDQAGTGTFTLKIKQKKDDYDDQKHIRLFRADKRGVQRHRKIEHRLPARKRNNTHDAELYEF